MTVLSLKLSRVLDVNTQNALELFVGKIKIKKKKKKKTEVSPAAKAGICCFTLLGYCHLWELSTMTIRL